MAELLSKAFVTLESAIETVELAAATPGASIARGRLQAFSARFDAVCLAVNNGPAAAAPLGAAPVPPAFAAEAPAAAAASDEPSPVVPVEKKKRGRPRKESEVSQAEAAPKVPKPRGRPPKAKVEGAEPAPKKPRGRPPKDKVEGFEPAPKKPRGRPPKDPKLKPSKETVEEEPEEPEEKEEEDPPRQPGDRYEYNGKMWLACEENATISSIAEANGIDLDVLLAANMKHYGKALKLKSKLKVATAIEIPQIIDPTLASPED